jgi:hypothetical protein
VAMKLLSGYLDDVYMTWLSSSVNCCGPPTEQAPMRGEDSTIPTVLTALCGPKPDKGFRTFERNGHREKYTCFYTHVMLAENLFQEQVSKGIILSFRARETLRKDFSVEFGRMQLQWSI